MDEVLNGFYNEKNIGSHTQIHSYYQTIRVSQGNFVTYMVVNIKGHT